MDTIAVCWLILYYVAIAMSCGFEKSIASLDICMPSQMYVLWIHEYLFSAINGFANELVTTWSRARVPHQTIYI